MLYLQWFACKSIWCLQLNLPNCGIASCSVGWTPSFLLKRYVLTGIHDGPHEPFIADSVDFVVSQVESAMAKF